jgi:histidinol-phosphate/aromatic aminotransferase/cobyric acid decarboxylase-like protein
VCDFSITSNPLGPVPEGVRAAQRLLSNVEEEWTTPRGGDVKAILEDQGERIMSAPVIEQYPSRDDPELSHEVLKFLKLEQTSEADASKRLIFGNGASELIDLLARAAPEGPYCTSPFTRTQYREYDCACQAAGRKSADVGDAAILCLVNPTNPTGDFMERAEIEAWISENASPGCWVVVDQSFLCFAGPDWHQRGVSSSFIQTMLKRHINFHYLLMDEVVCLLWAADRLCDLSDIEIARTHQIYASPLVSECDSIFIFESCLTG